MARAAGVVAMGGYNTFCEILSFDKPALIMPRTAPRLEQFIRAERAAELGLVAMLSEDRGPRSAGHGGGAAPADRPAAALGRGHPRPARRHAERQPPRPEMARPGPSRARPGAGAPRRLSVPPPAAGPAGARRLCPQGLSAAVGNLHRAGDPGARTARARHPDRLAAPADRSRQPPGASRQIARRSALSAGISVPGAVARLARLAAGAPAAGLPPGVARAGSPICCATRPRTGCAGSARRWCWRPNCPADVGHLHAHFLHTPASVARYAALIAGLDWTVSAHAKDIWTIPDWEKRGQNSATRAGR